jgi:hypothetical protein
MIEARYEQKSVEFVEAFFAHVTARQPRRREQRGRGPVRRRRLRTRSGARGDPPRERLDDALLARVRVFDCDNCGGEFEGHPYRLDRLQGRRPLVCGPCLRRIAVGVAQADRAVRRWQS